MVWVFKNEYLSRPKRRNKVYLAMNKALSNRLKGAIDIIHRRLRRACQSLEIWNGLGVRD
jgi:hypothetical protein